MKYDNIRGPPPPTRAVASQSCPCTVCDLARLKNYDYKLFWDEHSNPVGAPSTKVESPPAKVLALCTKCFGTLGKGVPHDCSKSKMGGNLANIVNTTLPHTRAKLAATTVHNIASSDEGVSTRGGSSTYPI